MNLLVETLIFFGIVFGLYTLWVKIFAYNYFAKRKIPHDKPRGVFGNIDPTTSFPLLFWDLYNNNKKHNVFGFFVLWKPVLLVMDIGLIKDIIVKNFSNFHDHGMLCNEDYDPLSGHLFALEGEKWKKLRTKLSPAFTSGRMKLMYPTIVRFSEKLVSYINEKPDMEPLEIFHIMSKYTLSNIASTAFGIESDVFQDDSKFMEMALKFNKPTFHQAIRNFMSFQLRGFAELIRFRFVPKDITEFYLKIVNDAVTYREVNAIKKNDFLQMLIQLKNKGSVESSPENDFMLTMNQISAQAFVFILAGFETSALAQSWTLYELALNPDIQARLRAEIDAMGEWTYENIMQLKYLDMVLSEGLRKWPVVPFLVRKCNEDFCTSEGLVIEKGTDVNISLIGMQRNPEFFPDPEKFDPERFGPNPPHEIKPFTYLPFGEGPRFCIGMRFGKMQSKVGIATLVKNFMIEPSKKTPTPVQLNKQTIQIVPKDGFWVHFRKRNVDQSL